MQKPLTPTHALFAERLKESRLKAGYENKTDLAEELNIRLNRYCNFEYALRIPEIDLIKEIGRILNVDPGYLVGFTNEYKPYEYR